MTTFNRILFLKDHRPPSQQAVDNALELSRRLDARLTFGEIMTDRDEVSDMLRSERRAEMMAFLPTSEAIQLDYELLSGDLSSGADRLEERFDLVYLDDSRTRSEARRRGILRSVRSSPLPVWLDRGPVTESRRIVAALDVQTRDARKRALNRTILDRTFELASALEAEIELVSVWTPSGIAGRLSKGTGSAAGSGAGGLDIARKRLQKLAADGARRSGAGIEPHLVVVGGSPRDLIAESVKARSADLLIAGCRGRKGLSNLVLGNTVEKLRERLTCSILSISAEAGDDSAAETGDETRAA